MCAPHWIHRRWPAVWWLAFLASSACASESLALDPTRSHAEFEVRLMWLVGVRGEFGTVHGTVTLDRLTGTAEVEARIATDELHMHSRAYEAWAKSAEFFDSVHFPEIAFASAPFPLERLLHGGALDGVLTVRGKSRPVRSEIGAPSCADPLAGACPMQADASIRRSDFDMRTRSATLADRVRLRLAVYVRPAEGPS
jgi:polyisoprenoid-binding protein YceI